MHAILVYSHGIHLPAQLYYLRQWVVALYNNMLLQQTDCFELIFASVSAADLGRSFWRGELRACFAGGLGMLT